MALAQLGQRDEAFRELTAALAAGYRDAPGLWRSRWFAPLRGDPRFAPLMASHAIAAPPP